MTLFYLLGLAAAISSVMAQTWTTCNPLNETCAPDPALGTNYTWNFSTNSLMDNTIWNITNGAVDYTDLAAQFTIQRELDSPTVRSTFYILFGIVSVRLQAAPGQGVVSSVVLESDDLDEIDWEWIGSEGTVQSNYYSKGNATYTRGVHHEVTGNATDGFHNYTTYWTAEKLEWWIDGTLVRTVNYEDASGGSNYPQTPMTIRLGIWPGGDSSEPQGTRDWAGGEIDYQSGPYNMYVSSVYAQDFHTGREYTYMDKSGTWQSIQVTPGNSAVAAQLSAQSMSVAQRWANLPQAAKAGILGSIAGVIGLGLVVMAFCCVRQRRLGRQEFNIQNAKFNQERTEMMNLQTEWKQRAYAKI